MVLIDQSDDIQSLRKSEIFWQERLKTFLPNDLNEKEVALEILVTYFNSLLYYIYISIYFFTSHSCGTLQMYTVIKANR